jgi:predicted PurR-regulated permease PerM
MLGIDRRAARAVWTAALVLLLMGLVYLVRRTLFVFILAVLFAYLLSPLVNLLDRFLPTRTRTPALALAYIIFLGVAVLAGIQIGSLVVEQAHHFVKDFPDRLQGWQAPSPDAPPWFNNAKANAVGKIRTAITERTTDLLSALPQAGLRFITVASDVIYVVVIPILAFFFLKDGRAIRQHFLEVLEEGPRRALLDDVLADINVLLAHYMRSLVVLSLAAFTAYGIFFSILGVPYGVLLAALGGLLEFIPMVGPLTASAAIILVAAISGSHVLTVLIFLVAYRMLQDYILSPHLMERGVQIHPLLVLFGVFAGGEVAGIAGTFLSVPALAMVRILYLRVRRARLHPGGSARTELAAETREP